MMGLDMVGAARDDLERLQSVLSVVEVGLDTVETTAEAVQIAQRGFRRAFRMLLIVGAVGLVVGVVLVAVRSLQGDADEAASADAED